MKRVITGRNVTHRNTTNAFQDLKPSSKRNVKIMRKQAATQNTKKNVTQLLSKTVLLFQRRITNENAKP